ncbi:MAG: DUF1540 domain-containing protein [Clostridia bacterium]|nr:DUF1540 domain-containing protein [Clostridia bacterium]
MKFNKPLKTDYPIEGVKCTVEGCYYNTQDGGCSAAMIEVANAKGAAKTDCQTYTDKQ